MLAYRHGFHAGNHGDVLKHVVLVHALGRLLTKPTALMVVDTHAGAGAYRLDDRHALTTREFDDGIGRLWGRTDAPPAVADYLGMVRRFNAGEALLRYPGSPAIARALMRPRDPLRLFELHPTDLRQLAASFGRDRACQVTQADGFEALRSLLPPVSRRALVLVDPSYELLPDYARVVACVRDALARFAQGVYVVWYPMVARAVSAQLPARLSRLARAAPKGWLHASLSLAETDEGGHGMTGSGVVVINPPHTLAPALREALPWLRDALARGPRARWLLEGEGQEGLTAPPRSPLAARRSAFAAGRAARPPLAPWRPPRPRNGVPS